MEPFLVVVVIINRKRLVEFTTGEAIARWPTIHLPSSHTEEREKNQFLKHSSFFFQRIPPSLHSLEYTEEPISKQVVVGK